jgi:hypothetical protein
MLSLFGRLPLRFEMFYLLGLIIMFLLFGAISQIGNLDPGSELRTGRGISGLVIVLLVAAGLVIHMFLNIWNWRQVVAYARTGRMPNNR